MQPGRSIISIAAFILTANTVIAQTVLTIPEAYRLAKENYPLSKQHELIGKTREYTVSNAAKGYLPQLGFYGQATLQSDVTNLPLKVPIAGFSLPSYNKDQYHLYGELDQLIYDGGMIRNQQESARVTEQIQEASLTVDLYALYDRINQLFFGILLLDRQLQQNEILLRQIREDIDKTDALVRNGIAYSSSLDELRAQLLQTGQARIELQSLRKAFLDVLGQFTGLPLNEQSQLETPEDPTLTDSIHRPEITLFELQKRNFDLQDQIADAQWKPRLTFYFQTGYARPGLNMLSNQFSWYYIGGFRLSWNLGSLYTIRDQKRLSALGRRNLDIQQETFLFNIHASQRQNNREINKYFSLLRDDQHIIDLRTRVKEVARAQMQNGVLSIHDYLTQLTAQYQAIQNRLLHQMQLLQSEYNYRNLSGNP